MSATHSQLWQTASTVALRSALLLASTVAGVSCSSGDSTTGSSSPSAGSVVRVEPPPFVHDVSAAIDAVEEELGRPQEYFEVTANAQLTNVFVAVDNATAAVAYVFVDGEVQPPAPKMTGATGDTFAAADIDFDPTLLLSGVSIDLPTSTIESLSVYGNEFGASYVLAASSTSGGVLDIEVGPQGDVLSVNPT